MCGIIGGTDPSWNFEAAVKALQHRGPDARDIVRLGDFSLGFTRLAIIDLSLQGNQPMANHDGQVYIVFNGEIYGYRRIRDELKVKGFAFRGESDTEVLLNAYLHWGDKFVDHLDGMFAICLYDNRIKKLKLFRDRPGIKPLYYLYDNGRFAFASELKGLTALCSNYDFKIDNTAIYDYLTYFYIPDPKSLYKNVFKLRPAHQLTYDLESKKIIQNRSYWQLQPDPTPKTISVNEAGDRLRQLIKASVKDQIIADVPLGFFLSGGLDSSIVVAESKSLSNKVNTFSIGFDDTRRSEVQYAEKVAALLGTNHRVKILSFQENQKLLQNLRNWYDEPFADTSAMPTYLVSQFAKEHVTVALSGDGGDELFGGYRHYQKYQLLKQTSGFLRLKNPHILSSISKLKAQTKFKSGGYRLLNFLTHLVDDDLLMYSKIIGKMDPVEKIPYAKELGISKGYDDLWFLRQYLRKELPTMTRLQYIDFHTYLPCDILTKVDRVSMAVSLEVRVPLLSRDIIEFAFGLPEDIRFWKGQLKGLVRQAYKGILPKEILERPKQGFGIPLKYLDSDRGMPHIDFLSRYYNIKINPNFQ